ncbi:Hypothetical protein SRAE_1000062100 [Strongyloides ratti]|uniref:DUF19 domain-containing protein n=1 Tax=Strongyloides ratti TaxID=34506 RepID=A0A090MUP6_STRRB|nr:Hypothetical protein SRAE_1000062100 [Strongyloides ratti]CEF62348.1 Hypothetical protein SRAE_1000062100 [Strongyloides ratti]
MSCTNKFGDPIQEKEIICNSEIFKQQECTINKNLGCLITEMKLEKKNGLCFEIIYKTCGFNEPHASQYKGPYTEVKDTDYGKEILTKTRCFTNNCNI